MNKNKKSMTETETVIKRIIPYLKRRGYDIDNDMEFESKTDDDGISRGYIDILIEIDGRKCFIIEAKKISKTLNAKDKAQALRYAKAVGVPFAVLTNGINIYCYNSNTKNRMTFDGKYVDKIPKRVEMPNVMNLFKKKPKLEDFSLDDSLSLPYRHGISQRQLNSLFEKCHGIIRKIEKYEQDAFEDFSKILFLKLLEEKAENESGRPNAFKLPYTYRFYELAKKDKKNADQVKDAIEKMIDDIKKITKYSEVLGNGVGLKHANTYYALVKELDTISFSDCSTDVKGSAFEYYVRATLKGKKLGQYFTPRNLVRIMYSILGEEKVYDMLKSKKENEKFKILDPACGTAGFLVYMLQRNLTILDDDYASNRLTYERYTEILKRIKELTFYGSDANEAVAAAAKMNMIIAGDGQTNIRYEDSLKNTSQNWHGTKDEKTCISDIDIIMTNPPFGTSESDSLSDDDISQYNMTLKKGQVLFIEKMIWSTKPGGEILTVIDQGIINTDSNIPLRQLILQECQIKAIVELPIETFKPNKINVKASLLYLRRKTKQEIMEDKDYYFYLVKLNTLGFDKMGKDLRGFNLQSMIDDITNNLFKNKNPFYKDIQNRWCFNYMKVSEITADPSIRFDYKFLEPETRKLIDALYAKSNTRLKDINTIPTMRGKSPNADQYVDECDGFAIVIKAGNITKYGTINMSESDWVEKSTYDEYEASPNHLSLIAEKGDVLVASTGEGTLGKTAVYDKKKPAIVDGHVTIVRVDPNIIDPYYLAAYLRRGAGALQITRAYTGATGLIELTTDMLDSVVIDMLDGNLECQKKLARQLENLEKLSARYLKKADEAMAETYNIIKSW